MNDKVMRGTRGAKKIYAALAAALLLSVLSAPALADDGVYIGNFPTGSSVSTATEGGEALRLTALSGGVSYSPDTDMFYREVGSGSFGISVPDGAIVTGAVCVQLPPTLTGTLYRNGTEAEGADLASVSEPGKYVLAVSAGDAAQEVRVTFTVAAPRTGSITEYKMPADFYVVSATLNGEEASYSQTRVDMTGDGDYVVSYRSPEADKDMRLELTVDHTPPTAVLTGITDGKANGTVTISPTEEDTRVYVLRNGERTKFTGAVSETGAYTVTLQDSAGNETVYDFIIVSDPNAGLGMFAAMVAVLVLALAGCFAYYRKFIRVS